MTPFPPIDSGVLQAVIETFQRVAGIVLGITSAVFIARVALLIVQVEGAHAFADLVRDTVVLLLALAIFPFVLKTVVMASAQIASAIRFEAYARSSGAIDNLLGSLKTHVLFVGLLSDIGDITVLHLVRAVFSLLIGLLAVAAPLIFISGYVLGQGIGVAALGSSLLAFALWPVLWNVIGLLSSNLWPSFQSTSLSSIVFSIAVTVLQFFSPLFCLALLRQVAPQSALRTVTGIALKMAGGLK
ncbi:MAG: hypothetical protein JNJ49_05160 [Bdellovibrionaceae bacterium]|nr:hypothetical protein [Pseudobdellovibrionaceae bacterium]